MFIYTYTICICTRIPVCRLQFKKKQKRKENKTQKNKEGLVVVVRLWTLTRIVCSNDWLDWRLDCCWTVGVAIMCGDSSHIPNFLFLVPKKKFWSFIITLDLFTFVFILWYYIQILSLLQELMIKLQQMHQIEWFLHHLKEQNHIFQKMVYLPILNQLMQIYN